ncbi:sugar transferase [Pedobacter sp. MC2016-05]|uniref:sugar transferase n=1 Tax=Pedobacter sp. MC2016-05 TaxID=2994474 RepID=UPI0022463C86|nr:sugar transferase [Pedobacter sp. MC2016-05]MCX2473197.1 sugar transferase [Pedobacter sp. MC2016-05]
MNSTSTPISVNNRETIRVVYAGTGLSNLIIPFLNDYFQIKSVRGIAELDDYIYRQTLITLPDAILVEVDDVQACQAFVERLKRNTLLSQIIIIFLSKLPNDGLSNVARYLYVHDHYSAPVPVENLRDRILFLIKFRSIQPRLSQSAIQIQSSTRNFPLKKRMFDLTVCIFVFLLMAPIFALIALAIFIESDGPIIYRSKRVGARYKIFDFFKFRSMHHHSNVELKSLSDSNQYKIIDGENPIFNKIQNDPRVTHVGRFIRKYSLDELPQLFNVIRGDMSLVGNRPLPLYEAVCLTSDEWAVRFLAPAGLTGLWQVSRRGKKSMSERERKKLDNFYAKNYSLRLDIKIILSTLPAMVQKGNV